MRQFLESFNNEASLAVADALDEPTQSFRRLLRISRLSRIRRNSKVSERATFVMVLLWLEEQVEQLNKGVEINESQGSD